LKSCINNISFYPAFSPKSHGLLVIESLHNTLKTFLPPKISESSDIEENKDLEDDLFNLIKSVRLSYESFNTLIVLKRMDWCGITEIEKQMPSFKNLFTMDKKEIVILIFYNYIYYYYYYYYYYIIIIIIILLYYYLLLLLLSSQLLFIFIVIIVIIYIYIYILIRNEQNLLIDDIYFL